MVEKYETPEIEFVEMEEKDVIRTSGGYDYGDVLTD